MKKSIRRVAAVALVTAIAALGVSGCASSGSTGSSSTKYKVGVTFPTYSNPVWAELVKEAVTYGATKNMDVTYVDAGSNSATQVAQIENFIAQGDKAIIICAVESNALTAVTARARKAGVKIISYTQELKNSDAQFLVNAYDTGYANGESAAKWINKVYPGTGTVEWGLEDLPKYPEIIARAQGIKDAIAKLAPQAKLVATAPAEVTADGVTNAQNFLQANPNIKVIASIGGGGAAGAIEGAKGQDPAKFGIFGIDATEPEVKDILDGGLEKSTVSLGGGVVHAHALIDLTADLLAGKTVKNKNYMPITVIDSTNVKAYYAKAFGK